MLTQIQLMPMLQIVDPILKTAIITLTTSIQDDGIEIARTNNSMTFQSDQIAEVKTFLGVDTSNEITYLTAIWAL